MSWHNVEFLDLDDVLLLIRRHLGDPHRSETPDCWHQRWRVPRPRFLVRTPTRRSG